MTEDATTVDLDPAQLLGFDQLAADALAAGTLSDPRAAMVGVTKPPPPPPPPAT